MVPRSMPAWEGPTPTVVECGRDAAETGGRNRTEAVKILGTGAGTMAGAPVYRFASSGRVEAIGCVFVCGQTGREDRMLDHVDFAVKDLARSRSFYVAALAPLGIVPVIEFDRADGHKGTGFGRNGIGVLFIGGGAAVGGRLHVALRASSNEAVDAFHAAAVKAGGVDHGAPGFRPRYGEAYYAAFVRDPDGRIIEAVCRGESETTSRTK